MTKLKKTAILDDDGKIIGYEAKAKNIQIRVCKKKDADPIIIANHYSHKVTRNSFYLSQFTMKAKYQVLYKLAMVLILERRETIILMKLGSLIECGLVMICLNSVKL